MVLSVLTGEKSQAEVCREHQLSAQQFGNWKRQFLENASSAFEKPDTSEEADANCRARTDGGTVDDATGNCKKSLQHLALDLNQKREIVMKLRPEYPITELCAVLDCARSSFYYQSTADSRTDG